MVIESCLHPNQQKTRRTQSNGTVVVALQCLTCGKHVRSAPKAGEDMEKLPEFDSTIRDKAWEAHHAELERLRQENSKEWWDSYNAYLKTDHWKYISRLVRTRDIVCQVCQQNPTQEAHHLSYASFNRYGISFAVECVGVCRPCHEEFLHEWKFNGHQSHPSQENS